MQQHIGDDDNDVYDYEEELRQNLFKNFSTGLIVPQEAQDAIERF